MEGTCKSWFKVRVLGLNWEEEEDPIWSIAKPVISYMNLIRSCIRSLVNKIVNIRCYVVGCTSMRVPVRIESSPRGGCHCGHRCLAVVIEWCWRRFGVLIESVPAVKGCVTKFFTNLTLWLVCISSGPIRSVIVIFPSSVKLLCLPSLCWLLFLLKWFEGRELEFPPR